MQKQKSSGILSFIQDLYFQDVGNKFKPGTLRKLNSLMFIVFEKIAINFDIFLYDYLKIYKNLVEDEIKLRNITSYASILVIGCGSVPSSCILLAKETQAQITGIDIDEKAVKKAKKLIKKLELEAKIKIKLGNGSQYDLKDFNIIMILYGVKSLDQIFDHLSKNLKKDSKVILRAPSSFIPEDSKTNFNILQHFKQETKKNTKSFGTFDLYLFKKI